mmetsp:Transcript_15402/g.22748  ORF Transcript_15402/g.22748 Transcript_15402/m.22748 type:complete len:656 (-) Transcript_15402:1166-3133(-)
MSDFGNDEKLDAEEQPSNAATTVFAAEEEEDDEGLLKKGYDVIIIGTGIIQSITACALSLAGKKVLHCDGNDFYGELDASFNLQDMIGYFEGLQQQTRIIEEDDIHRNDNASENGTSLNRKQSCDSERNIKLHPHLSSAGLRVLSMTPTLRVNEDIDTVYGPGMITDVKSRQYTKTLTIQLSKFRATLYQVVPNLDRLFCLDLNPKLILNHGDAVQGLISSGVSNYLEFKGVLGMNVVMNGDICEVPSNKSEVFKCNYITNIEKRKLMRLLGVVRDYGTAKYTTFPITEEEDDNLSVVTSLNERQLNAGRALHRPQNKSVNNKQIDDIEHHLDKQFSEYLTNCHKLPQSLISLVQYALAMDHGSSISTELAMSNTYRYLNSLGKFHIDTGFLQSMYGTGEFSSSFCRSAAVHGTTYLLRRRASSVVLDDDNKVKGIILQPDPDGYGCKNEKFINCSNLVIPSNCEFNECDESSSSTRSKISRKIVILRIDGVPDEQRHLTILPPGTVGNISPIHILHLDSHVCVAPTDYMVLHFVTNTDCGEDGSLILKRAYQFLKSRMYKSAEELWQVTFSLNQASPETSPATGPSNMFYATGNESMLLDGHFKLSQTVFEQIVDGDKAFLVRDKEVLFHNLEDDEEDEDAELRKALELVGVEK